MTKKLYKISKIHKDTYLIGKSVGDSSPESISIYRVCGLAVTAGIAMKFGTAHGRSRLGVGGAKYIGPYGRKGVPLAPHIFGTSKQKITPPTDL